MIVTGDPEEFRTARLCCIHGLGFLRAVSSSLSSACPEGHGLPTSVVPVASFTVWLIRLCAEPKRTTQEALSSWTLDTACIASNRHHLSSSSVTVTKSSGASAKESHGSAALWLVTPVLVHCPVSSKLLVHPKPESTALFIPATP